MTHWKPQMHAYQAVVLANLHRWPQRLGLSASSHAADAAEYAIGDRVIRGMEPTSVIIDELPLHNLRYEPGVTSNYSWDRPRVSLDVKLDPVTSVARMKWPTVADVLELRKRFMNPDDDLDRIFAEIYAIRGRPVFLNTQRNLF